MTDFAWLIEAPGQQYLGTRQLGQRHDFYWTTDHNAATRFISKDQADGVYMAVRRLCPELFAFEVNLTDARPVEHGWIAHPSAMAEAKGEVTAEELLSEIRLWPKSSEVSMAQQIVARFHITRRGAK